MAIRFVIKQNGPGKAAKDNLAIAEYVFDESLFTIGSDAANDLVLDKSAAEQAVVVREEESLTLINRAEGTTLNGRALRREAFQPLGHGDRIEIGAYVIFVFDSETPGDFSPENDRRQVAEIPKPAEPIGPDEEPAGSHLVTRPDQKAPKPAASSNFAAILDTLRTEEDSFYFIVQNKALKEIGRIRLEQAEIMIGFNQRGEIVADVAESLTILAVARKDWNGILLEAGKPNTVFVNGEIVVEARRLRNEDRVSFAAAKQTLVLHEPSSLVALESMRTTREASEARFGIHKTSGAEEAANASVATVEKNEKSPLERKFFGYFSFLEVVTMFFVTLIGAVLVFLFLEFAFS